MLQHRPLAEIGGGDLGWLKAKHHLAIDAYGTAAQSAVGAARYDLERPREYGITTRVNF